MFPFILVAVLSSFGAALCETSVCPKHHGYKEIKFNYAVETNKERWWQKYKHAVPLNEKGELPIWTLQNLPANTAKVVICPVDLGIVLHNATITDPASRSETEAAERFGSQILLMDVTRYGIRPNHWYLLEMHLNFLDPRTNDVEVCTYHQLLYTSAEKYVHSQRKMISAKVLEKQNTISQTMVRYEATNMPVPEVQVSALLHLIPDQRRCTPYTFEEDLWETSFTLRSNTVADTLIGVLRKDYEYEIETVVKFNLTMPGANGNTKQEITIADFLHGFSGTNLKIDKCEDESETSKELPSPASLQSAYGRRPNPDIN